VSYFTCATAKYLINFQNQTRTNNYSKTWRKLASQSANEDSCDKMISTHETSNEDSWDKMISTHETSYEDSWDKMAQ